MAILAIVSDSKWAAGRLCRAKRFDLVHPGVPWALPAGGQHGVDSIGGSGEHRFDIAAGDVSHPARQVQLTRLARGPGAKVHALNAARNADMDGADFAHRQSSLRQIP